MLKRGRFNRSPVLMLSVLFLLHIAAEAGVYMVWLVDQQITKVIYYESMLEVANTYDPSQYVNLTSGCSVDVILNLPPDRPVLLNEAQMMELQQALNSPPTASAGGPYSGVQGTAINVSSAGSTDSDGTITDYAWDLDNDGQYDDATGVNATFSSVVTGEFTIVVRVLDNDGGAATDAATVTVHPFLITSCSSSSVQPFTLSWQSNTGNVYTIVHAADISSGWQSAVGYEDVPGTGSLMTFTNQPTVGNSMFFQVLSSAP